MVPKNERRWALLLRATVSVVLSQSTACFLAYMSELFFARFRFDSTPNCKLRSDREFDSSVDTNLLIRPLGISPLIGGIPQVMQIVTTDGGQPLCRVVTVARNQSNLYKKYKRRGQLVDL